MNRRDFLATASAVAIAPHIEGLARLFPPSRAADHTLTIAPLKLELAPGKIVRTVAYNGSVPGPLLRMKQGVPVTVDVVNDSDTDEFVHWHGLHIPSDVDGAMEEGSPAIPAHGRRSYTFTPDPAGTRWYHSHQFAGKNFNRSTYTGQFGFLMIDAPGDPARTTRRFSSRSTTGMATSPAAMTDLRWSAIATRRSTAACSARPSRCVCARGSACCCAY